MNTTYFKNLIMGNVFATSTGTPLPSNYYIGLSSTTPTLAGGNVNEPSAGNGYARVRLTSLTVPDTGMITNDAPITWEESTGPWFPSSTPATYYVIYDAATGGNLLMYNQLAASRVIEANTIVTIASESLHLQLTD